MSRILGGELGWGSGTQADGMCVSTCAHGRPVSASQAGGVLFNMFGSSFCFDNMVNLSPNRYPLEESLPWKKGESRCTAASLSWPTDSWSPSVRSERPAHIFVHESFGHLAQEMATTLI